MSGQGFSIGLAAVIATVALFGVRGPEPKPAAPAMEASAPSADEEGERPESAGNGYASVAIDRSADGHFYADARVNGAKVRFLIDTGATTVALTRADALRAGIGNGDFSATGVGAGGTVKLMETRIAHLALGPIDATSVPAVVVEDNLRTSLLGQSYLSRIESVSISRDRMTLR
jgi:aspartyl protease family protein